VGVIPPRRLGVCCVALLAAVTALTGCAGRNAVDQSAGSYRFVSATASGRLIAVADRKKAGDFTGGLLSGGSITLAQDAGHIVVINFWATWCGPCTTETPQFDTVYRAYKSRGVDFIGIDTKETSRSSAQAFVADNMISYPIVFDEPGSTAIALGKIPALALPFTVLVDKQQRVAAVYLRTLTPNDLEPVLNQLVAET
jgi:peroxiredoxin